jgi:glutamate racemase
MSAPGSKAQACHHILVFDSGLGGLSIAREIIAAHPYCCVSYLADTAYFPYGTKSDAVLIERIETLLQHAIQTLAPDIVVIACNTASTLTLSHLRSRFALPFVGVVPAIKPAAGLSLSKTIGVLATPATVSRPYTAQLISDFASGCEVITFGTHGLVALAERSLCGETPNSHAVKNELTGLIHQSATMDTVVLACTHFPLLLNELKHAAPHILHWVDSGAAVARQVGVWMARVPPRLTGLITAKINRDALHFFSTQAYDSLEVQRVQTLLGRQLLIDAQALFHGINTHVKN